MYAPFFGLEQPPFSIAPDPRYLFMSERHREALAHLLYGLDAGGGFVLLTGEIGAGKTTVCRCFLEQIPPQCNVAYIFNPKLTVPELLRSICDEFGVAHQGAAPGGETVKDCIDPLNAFLLAQHAAGRNNVLIIDEAQSLAPDVLEQLRLLTNLETRERKLLQIILIGQPELRALIASPALEQLAQRVIARYHLGALSAEETAHYIAHRMAVAGWQGPPPFARRALARIHALTRGVPRRINLLCDRALLGAYAANVREVSDAMVRQAAREVFDANAPSARPRRALAWAAAGALAGAAAVAVIGWTLADQRPVPAVAPPATTLAAASTAETAPALPAFLERQSADDAAPWQMLAQAWQTALPASALAQPCAALPAQGLRCYRNRRASLGLLRQIDRPALLTLAPAGSERTVTVLLRRLEGETATLEGADGQTLRAPLAQLTPLWRGEIATLWKMPPGLPEGDAAATAQGAAWVDEQLTRAGVQPAAPQAQDSAEPRRARIRQFQRAQGLTPDGVAGPLTLMLLTRAAGAQEPRLAR
jgi:general secretion pathway protein A